MAANMRLKPYLYVLAGIALLLNSCSLDDDQDDFRFVSLPVLSADLPESFELNETYTIKVTYLIPDSCTLFEGFDITREGNSLRNVVAVGTRPENRSCAEIAQEGTASFEFICLYENTYRFRFWSGTDENGEALFIEYEVPVTTRS